MEKRRLGRTGHYSSIVTLGCASLCYVTQQEADRTIELALSHGVNHFDVAPTYGEAELRLRPWMKDHREEVFVACKTMKRTKRRADEELRRSLERTGAKYFDLYQLHALDELDELGTVFGSDGALQTMLEARKRGIIKHIGITSHRPLIITEALKLFDFDTVLFPLNFVLKKHHDARSDYEPILRIAKERDIGTIAMKTFAKQPWQKEKHPYVTWYEPFDNQTHVEQCLWFALSQNVTTVASAADIELVPKILRAADRYHELTENEQLQIIKSTTDVKPLFPESEYMNKLINWRKSQPPEI